MTQPQTQNKKKPKNLFYVIDRFCQPIISLKIGSSQKQHSDRHRSWRQLQLHSQLQKPPTHTIQPEALVAQNEPKKKPDVPATQPIAAKASLNNHSGLVEYIYSVLIVL